MQRMLVVHIEISEQPTEVTPGQLTMCPIERRDKCRFASAQRVFQPQLTNNPPPPRPPTQSQHSSFTFANTTNVTRRMTCAKKKEDIGPLCRQLSSLRF
jgi:hypothetical protein